MENLEIVLRISRADLKALLEEIRQIVRQELGRASTHITPPPGTERPAAPASKHSLTVSKAEAAKILGVSCRTIDYSIALKEISVLRVGRRVLVPLKSLETVIQRGSLRTGRIANPSDHA